MTTTWRQVVAALADEQRLRLFARLVTARAADEGADGAGGVRHADLSAAERRSLGALRRAGLVTVDDDGGLHPVPGRFAELLAAPASAARPTGPERFLTGGADGRLESMPRRQRDRDEVVRYLAAQVLVLHEPVTEPTLTRRLAERSVDPVGLRRAMVDAGLVARTRDGAAYWRTRVTEFDDL